MGCGIILLVILLIYTNLGRRGSNSLLELPPLPPSFISHGIDVSHHQGPIDWENYKLASDSLLSFVYCKSTEGLSHVDSQWKKNREQLLELGIAHGTYHFFQPLSNPAKQAEHFLAHYSPQAGDLPPVLDAETMGSSDAQLIEAMKIWLNAVETKTGQRPIIYTSHDFYRTKFIGKFPKHQFWIANYNANVSGLEDPQIVHWQYNDHGNVPGINGPVDMNYSKIDFQEAE